MIDIMQSHNSVTFTKEERLRGKAESTDPIPFRLTNNYAFHWVFNMTCIPKRCGGFINRRLYSLIILRLFLSAKRTFSSTCG